MKVFLSFFFLLTLLVISPRIISASMTEDVLGESINTEIQYPALSSGPGFILPDSALYSLDKIYQRMRLALIFTAEKRAEIHDAIAGERLAEFRVMSMRGNSAGIDTALLEFSRESLSAASQLQDASIQGRDVTELSYKINQSLSERQKVLVGIASQTEDSSLGQKISAVIDSLRDAKIIALESLPELDKENEIAALVEDELDRAVLGVASSAVKLEKRLGSFEKQASKSAQKELKKTQKKTVNKALLEKQKLLEQKKVQLQKLQEQRKKQTEQVRKTVKEAKEAAKKLREARKEELKALKEQREVEKQSNSSTE